MRKLYEQMKAQNKKVMSNIRLKPTRTAFILSSNQKILYGYTCGRKDSPQEGRVSLWLEEIDPTRLCKG